MLQVCFVIASTSGNVESLGGQITTNPKLASLRDIYYVLEYV